MLSELHFRSFVVDNDVFHANYVAGIVTTSTSPNTCSLMHSVDSMEHVEPRALGNAKRGQIVFHLPPST